MQNVNANSKIIFIQNILIQIHNVQIPKRNGMPINLEAAAATAIAATAAAKREYVVSIFFFIILIYLNTFCVSQD